ncbi:MAG: toll/interleukin-1 receptor domain-containing protein, partial [Gammaproteobacteria bacterium]|nr:toll/interleukin-1 receptor domain-containing protein [Gammaproteobacteria bacterium]
LPAFVKLLPRFPAGGESPPVTITNYLREFLADDQWSYGDKPSSKEIDYIAAKFAENSFWPTGDNRAGQLFFFAIATFLLILYPVKTPDLALFLASMVLVAAIAYCVRGLFFLMLNSSLSFVDERLTLKRPELISEMESSQIAIRSKVFISYRREDSAPYARLIHQSLSDFMDENEIFMDIDAIEDGEDFVQAIETAVSDCDVMLVVVGKRWANISSDDGEKRLFQVRDFVRLEVASALKQDCHVIPVLVGGAEMPAARELPPDLEAFVRRHARELSDKHWKYDIQQLARAMAEN